MGILNNKGYWSARAVNAFNEGKDQDALRYAMLGYDGSVQNIQLSIQKRNMDKQLQQQKVQMQQQADESEAQLSQQANQNQKQQVQNVKKENSGKNNQNLTQGQSSSGTWLKQALKGNDDTNNEEWY